MMGELEIFGSWAGRVIWDRKRVIRGWDLGVIMGLIFFLGGLPSPGLGALGGGLSLFTFRFLSRGICRDLEASFWDWIKTWWA